MKKIRLLFIASIISIAVSCSKSDPCEETVCYNNAACVDGTCQCPEGYKGTDCSEEQTPSKVKLTQIIITRFPAFKSNGDNWDETSGVAPDIYVTISRAESEVYSSPKPTFEDANVLDDYPIEINPAVELNPIGQAYTINLYDFDGVAGSGFDEPMGSVDFLPYHSGEGFKKVVEVKNDDVGFELHYEYVF